MNQKHKQSIHPANVKVNLMGENVIQINGVMTTNIKYLENFIFAIPIYIAAKMENI